MGTCRGSSEAESGVSSQGDELYGRVKKGHRGENVGDLCQPEDSLPGVPVPDCMGSSD